MSLSLVNYITLTNDLNSVFSTGATPNLCLFTDAEGTVPFADAEGDTADPKAVVSVNYTQPHNDSEGNPIVNGFITITFTDKTKITITDNVDTVYYSIVAIPFKPRTF